MLFCNEVPRQNHLKLGEKDLCRGEFYGRHIGIIDHCSQQTLVVFWLQNNLLRKATQVLDQY